MLRVAPTKQCLTRVESFGLVGRCGGREVRSWDTSSNRRKGTCRQRLHVWRSPVCEGVQQKRRPRARLQRPVPLNCGMLRLCRAGWAPNSARAPPQDTAGKLFFNTTFTADVGPANPVQSVLVSLPPFINSSAATLAVLYFNATQQARARARRPRPAALAAARASLGSAWPGGRPVASGMRREGTAQCVLAPSTGPRGSRAWQGDGPPGSDGCRCAGRRPTRC